MALTITDLAAEPRSFSIGPVRQQIVTYTCLSTDTSATVTFDRLRTVYAIESDGGLVYTAAPTFSGNVATLAFTAPTGGGFGTFVATGK